MWLDLRPYLRPAETEGDLWAAERLLGRQIAKGGVIISAGERYQSEQPGNFRMNFSYDDAVLREGVRRSASPYNAKSDNRADLQAEYLPFAGTKKSSFMSRSSGICRCAILHGKGPI